MEASTKSRDNWRKFPKEMSRREDHEPTWRALQVYFYKRKYQNCSE